MKTLTFLISWAILICLVYSPVQSATLEYISGGLVVTPFLWGRVSTNHGEFLPEPIISKYNPGTSYGVNELSGNGEMAGIGPFEGVTGEVSWNLKAIYDKSFNLTMTSMIKINQFNGSTESDGFIRSSLGSQSAEGLFLRVMPETGENFGQSAKLHWNYIVKSRLDSYNLYDLALFKLESAESQPTIISINGRPVFFLSVKEMYFINQYNEDYALAIGSKEWYKEENYMESWINYSEPFDCKIGDTIGIYIGSYMRVVDDGSDLFGFPSIKTEMSLSLNAETSTVPLPGAFILLGAGLGRLVLYTHRKKLQTH